MAAIASGKALSGALEELARIAPDAPFLALGQTVLWDEPMKAGVALASQQLGYSRRFVAGVHDTDYFAKLPGATRKIGRYAVMAHNDTTTKGLWSAAAEFSQLFGSETVVPRETLQQAGLRLGAVTHGRPNLLDEATEAWGWRGVVSLDENPPVAGEVPLRGLFSELHKAFDWALDGTLEMVSKPDRPLAEERAQHLRYLFCSGADAPADTTLTQFYRSLLPSLYRFVSGQEVEIDTTATSELLRFNPETASLPRFELLRAFVEPQTRATACAAYDDAIRGSEVYTLDRFGTGAIPFDLVIPGKGRGTIRIGNRGIIVMCREPQFVSLKKPIQSLDEFAAAITAKFGPNCVAIGKAVTLIGMLAREFVFVFHEGASSYVKHSRRLHGLLQEGGIAVTAHPILRVRYSAWDAMRVCPVFLELPEPFRRPFGVEELCAPSFSARWREVARAQEAALAQMHDLRRPLDLIRYLDESVGGFWNCLAAEYDGLHVRLERLEQEIAGLRTERKRRYDERRLLRKQRVAAEEAKGAHFRAKIFEKSPSAEDLAERQRLIDEVERIAHAIGENEHEIRLLLRRQSELARDEEVVKIHERRRGIELEAELKRLRLIRSAVIVSRGLANAERRPSAWWFPIVCPTGKWFSETIETADYYLEPLMP
ncbi:MAG: hypothetical protein U0S12_00635 [Fimbriimonadales bacterium]